jgi:hypothetical protein
MKIVTTAKIQELLRGWLEGKSDVESIFLYRHYDFIPEGATQKGTR